MARVSLDTLIDRSVKNMGTGIHPVVKESMLEVVARAYKEGIYVQVSSGYRSNAEQQKLFNQGRTTPGNIVTNARPGQSLHNYGLAIDYFLVSDDGVKALWSVNDKWRRVAAIGKSLGFEWGGDWKGFVDYPHLQMTGGLSLSQLQAGKRPNLKSKVTGGVAQSGNSISDVKSLQNKLIKAGYKLPKFGADGYEGEETTNAIKQLQKDAGIKVDGIAGKSTIKALDEIIKGGLTVKQYEELKKIIDGQAKEIKALKKNKQDKPSDSQTPDPAHADNWKRAKEKGLLNGKNPQGHVTREQLSSILKNFYDRFIANPAQAEEYAEDALKWAQENNISDASKPAHLMSRQQGITIVHRAWELFQKINEDTQKVTLDGKEIAEALNKHERFKSRSGQ